MSDFDKQKQTVEDEVLSSTGGGPLVFISHDSRDTELAEAFSKLLKSVSAGMIKTFRASDKKGNEGIDFGDEWYKRLMTKLQSTTDVVCLFTENSLDRPWILFEAGVAKGKLNAPVIGLALGVPLSRVSTGPFYQFQNMDDSEDDLKKLVNQLSRRIPGLELDADVVKSQVSGFKKIEEDIIGKTTQGKGNKTVEATEESPIAKLTEEMKALPSRVVERFAEHGEPFRRRRIRRFHPMMIEELLFGGFGDPLRILMAASIIRDDAPWLYELAMDVYKAVKSEDEEAIQYELKRLQNFSESNRQHPFIEQLGIESKDIFVFCLEFPRMLQHLLITILKEKKAPIRRRPSKKQSETT